MIDNFKFGMVTFLIVIGLIFATIVACVAIDAYRDCQFIKAGYVRKTLPGYGYPQWVKEQPCGPRGVGNQED